MPDALPLWSVFQPDRDDPMPLQEQIAGFFRSAVSDGRLGPGARLPSSRTLADQLGVARNTVSLAYERLAAEGYVEGRRGGGTRIAVDLPDLAVPPPSPDKIGAPIATPRLSRAAETMMRERVGAAGDGPVPLRPGRPGLDQFPGRVWARLAGRFWRETSPAEFGYGDPAGHAPLRAALARYLGAFRGLAVAPSQILVTSGAQQAVDMVARALLDPDDPVILEEPCYPGLRGPIAATGAEIVPVPVDDDGLDVAIARKRAPNARMVVVTPTHQFPLGCTLSLSRRRALQIGRPRSEWRRPVDRRGRLRRRVSLWRTTGPAPEIPRRRGQGSLRRNHLESVGTVAQARLYRSAGTGCRSADPSTRAF